MNRRHTWIVAALLTSVAIVASVASALQLRRDEARRPGPMTHRAAQEFDAFALYDLGPRFDSLDRTIIEYVRSEPYPDEPIREEFVSFVYGDCVPSEVGGCGVPFEVQVWPACLRNPSVYADRGRPPLVLRGVPAQFYEQGTRLELSTADATVVLFGDSERQLRQAAQQLRSVNSNPTLGRTRDLPAPQPRADPCG